MNVLRFLINMIWGRVLTRLGEQLTFIKERNILKCRIASGLIQNMVDKTEKNVRKEKTTVKGYYITWANLP